MVTATRRASALLDTPVALSAYDADTLRVLGIRNGQDLATRTPSVSITSIPSKVSIRGVGRSNHALGSDPGVALYVDGVYFPEATILEANNLFDTERVEVLRGPQGTLYGRNAVGGAINTISMPPTMIWKTRVIAELGNYDSRVLQGLMSGPITDQLSMVVSGSTIERDGFQEEITTGEDFDTRDTQTLRASFKYHWTHTWYSRIQFNWADSKRKPSQGYRTLPFATDYIQVVNDVDSGRPLNLPGTFPGQNFANPHQGYPMANAAVRDPDKTQADLVPSEDVRSNSAYLLNEFALGDYRLKYLASYTDYEYDRLLDADGMNSDSSEFDWSNLYLAGVPVSTFTGIDKAAPRVSEFTHQEADFTSHDLQFYSALNGPVNFVSGLYYYRRNEQQMLALREGNDDIMTVYRFLGDLVGRNTSSENWLYRGRSDLETTSMAAYGQLSWDWLEQLRLTAGLRYSRDEKDGGDTTFVQWVGEGDISRRSEDDWDSVDWRLGLDYRPAGDHLVYGVLATGYRSGGFNYMKPTDSTAVDQVDPEDLLSFELGYKAQLLDGQLRLASAAYYYDYRDLQVLRPDQARGVNVRSFDNVDEASAWGFELEVLGWLNPHFMFGGSWSYNRTRYGEYSSLDANACALGPLAEGQSNHPLCTTVQDLEGNSFPLTPRHKLNLFVTLNWPVGDVAMDWTVNYSYVDEHYLSPFNLDAFDRVDSRDRWDSRLGANWGVWRLTAFVDNIADERNWVFRQRPSTVSHNYGSSAQLTRPRTYGLRLEYTL